MNLNADPISGARAAKTYVLDQQGISAVRVAEILSTYQQSLGHIGFGKVTHIQSSLVAGIGFVNLYEVRADGVTDLAQLQLTDLSRFEAVELNAELVKGLTEYLGDIDNFLYLMEYPDGFILSLNNQFLAFKPRWH